MLTWAPGPLGLDLMAKVGRRIYRARDLSHSGHGPGYGASVEKLKRDGTPYAPPHDAAENIGTADSVEAAKKLCEDHHAKSAGK